MSGPDSVKESMTRDVGESGQRRPLVSILVPAYNEAAIIEASLTSICDYMKSLEREYRWELIVVDDGSTDKTFEIAMAFCGSGPNVTVLRHSYNFRLGQALRYGFSKCRGDYVVVLDADLSYAPDHIGRLVEEIRGTKAKIVIASPYMKGGKVTGVPWLRKTLSIGANRFLGFFAKDKFFHRLSTFTGMVRAYDREFLSKLNLKAMDSDIMPEIIYKAMILRGRIVEIPAHLNWRAAKSDSHERKSSMKIARTMISSILSGFFFRPFMFFVIPGVSLTALSLYPIGWALLHCLSFYGISVSPGGERTLSAAVAEAFRLSPHSFILGSLMLMVGVQLLSLGILALQSKKYFEELFHLSSNLIKEARDHHDLSRNDGVR